MKKSKNNKLSALTKQTNRSQHEMKYYFCNAQVLNTSWLYIGNVFYIEKYQEMYATCRIDDPFMQKGVWRPSPGSHHSPIERHVDSSLGDGGNLWRHCTASPTSAFCHFSHLSYSVSPSRREK